MVDLILNVSETAFEETLKDFFTHQFHLLSPFHSLVLDFCSTLSMALFHHSNSVLYPDFSALAFWLRQSHLQQLKKHFFNPYYKKRLIRVPRGIAFHLPPSSIEVMCVYSWICSLLVGNGNIIRLPQTETPRMRHLLNVIDTVLLQAQFLPIRLTTLFIRYGHIDAITSWISSKVDVRVIWGGDTTIAKIRTLPLPAHGKDISFPDRFSFAAIDAESYLQTSTATRQQAAEHFFNDTFLFDQSACSSPRLIFWIGDHDTVAQSSIDFYNAVQSIIEKRKYTISLGAILIKQNYIYDAVLSMPIESILWQSNELCVLAIAEASNLCRKHCGQGLLYHLATTNLDTLANFTTNKDQTLSYYGFNSNQLLALATQVNGRGITRIVPFGQALHFDVLWDGIDLLDELSKKMMIYQG